MKIKQNIFRLICGIGILVFGITVIGAAETPPVQWNEMAQSQVMDTNELAKLGTAFPTWKIKQVTWPSASEINTNKVAADPNLTIRCMEWLSKFMKKEQLPTDLDKHLIAMRNWGLIREQSEQKRLCDVFIARFKKAPYVIHIQESPYNVVITVSDERLANKSTIVHQDLIIKIADLILGEALKPNPDSENFHLSSKNSRITHITWAIDSLQTIDSKGRKVLDLVKAGKVGATHVEAETDGRFVRFEIVKCPGAVKRAFFDPYTTRFSSPVGNSSANTIKGSDVRDIIKVLPTEYAKYKKQLTEMNDYNAAFALVSEAKAMLDKPAEERVHKTEDCKMAYRATWSLCVGMRQNLKDPAAQKQILEEWNNYLVKDDNDVPYQIYAIAYDSWDRNFLTDKFWELLRQTNKKKTISAIGLVLYHYGDSEDINKLEEKRDSVTDPELKQIIQNAINWGEYRLSGDKTTDPGPAAAPPRMDMSDD